MRTVDSPRASLSVSAGEVRAAPCPNHLADFFVNKRGIPQGQAAPQGQEGQGPFVPFDLKERHMGTLRSSSAQQTPSSSSSDTVGDRIFTQGCP